jgi:hypothetical protein
MPLANARTRRPVIRSTAPTSSRSLACWKNILMSRSRWCSPSRRICVSAGVRLLSSVEITRSGVA